MNDPSTWAENSICQSKSLTLPQQKQAKLKFKPFLVRSSIMQGPLTLFYLLLMMFQSAIQIYKKNSKGLKATHVLLFYPDAVILYYASDMILSLFLILPIWSSLTPEAAMPNIPSLQCFHFQTTIH